MAFPHVAFLDKEVLQESVNRVFNQNFTRNQDVKQVRVPNGTKSVSVSVGYEGKG